VIGNQEIEPAGKKRKAGQRVRPLHTELRTKYDNNNGIIPHAPSPASHQFWGQAAAVMLYRFGAEIQASGDLPMKAGIPCEN
jgi:hypothetical protein